MNPSTALATVFVDELVRGGVREAVLSPGSRSAPLAFALHAADADGRLRLHVRIDERSAGFLALGLAKVSCAPVVVVTTSGTAAVNLHPAVVEAAESGVPLIVLTADRPPELRGVGANQTIDQIALFGTSVRRFVEVARAETRSGQNAYWRSVICRALAAAQGTDDPGPVHLNVPFREPLVPGTATAPWPESLEGRPSGAPWTDHAAPASTVERAGGDIARTLVVVGDATPALGRAAAALAEAAGWPVISEPSGNARCGSHALQLGHLLLADADFLAAHLPERVLVVGRPTLHRSITTLLRRADIRVEVVAPGARWADAGHAAAVVRRDLPNQPVEPADDKWADEWLAADRALVSRAPAESPRAAEAAIAAALLKSVPADSLVFVGSSMPIRDLSAAVPRSDVTVYANRGAAGIDGTVSSAIGAALAHQVAGPRPAFALLGDLTFVHEAGGLMLGPAEPRPELTIVVVNNDGGAIFGLLEQGAPEYAESFERVFGTPHGTDFAALCGASGTPHTRVSSAAELAELVADPRLHGLQVVEIRTQRH